MENLDLPRDDDNDYDLYPDEGEALSDGNAVTAPQSVDSHSGAEMWRKRPAPQKDPKNSIGGVAIGSSLAV